MGDMAYVMGAFEHCQAILNIDRSLKPTSKAWTISFESEDDTSDSEEDEVEALSFTGNFQSQTKKSWNISFSSDEEEDSDSEDNEEVETVTFVAKSSMCGKRKMAEHIDDASDAKFHKRQHTATFFIPKVAERTELSSNSFSCRHCGREFRSWQAIKNHYENKHAVLVNNTTKLNQSTAYLRHTHQPKPMSCANCQRKFWSWAALQQHHLSKECEFVSLEGNHGNTGKSQSDLMNNQFVCKHCFGRFCSWRAIRHHYHMQHPELSMDENLRN